MSVWRDVLAKFTFLVDDKPLTEVDKKINKLEDRIKKFGKYGAAGFSAVAYGAYRAVEAASDVEETMNVLSKTFEKHQKSVITWSQTVGKAVGRSEYTLQNYASNFGAFLKPMVKGADVKQITTMSEALAKLSVDAASFYNVGDDEAAMRIRSGMAGETEAVRKFGIDLTDEGLNQFNKKENGGDGRKMRQMSQAEKTIIRYKKILADTKLLQGDAQDTALSWANSLKRVQEKIKDVTVALGRKLMPTAKRVLAGFEAAIDSIETTWVWLEEKTSEIRTIIFGVATYYVAQVGLMIAANKAYIDSLIHSISVMGPTWMKAAAGPAMLAAKMAVLFFVFEDIITAVRGGESYLNDFWKWTTNMSQPSDTLARNFEMIANGFDTILGAARDLLMVLPKLFDMMGQVAGGKSFGDAWKGMGDLFSGKGLITGMDANDVVQSWQAQDANTMANFQDAAARGDIQAAATQFRPFGVSEKDAAAMAWQHRGELIKAGKLAPTQEDIDKGITGGDVTDANGKMFLPTVSLTGKDTMVRPVTGPATYGTALSGYTGKDGKKIILGGVNITVNGAKDSKAVADDVMGHIMRVADANADESGDE